MKDRTEDDWNRRSDRWMLGAMAMLLVVIPVSVWLPVWAVYLTLVVEAFCGWRAVRCADFRRIARARELSDQDRAREESTDVDQQINNYL